MKSLSPHDVVGNCRIAFDAAECLGIPRVIEPSDMSMLAVPDKLAVMTYLYQLRAHFTGHQLQIEQIGNTSDESSYIIGNYKSDNLPSQNILTLDHLKKQLTQQHSIEDDVDRSDEKSPIDKKDVKNLILTGSKHLLGKVLSPVKDKQFPTNNNKIQTNGSQSSYTAANTPASKENTILMTRRELNDPFGSDDEDEQQSGSQTQKTTNDANADSQRNNSHVNKVESPISNLDPATANVRIFFIVMKYILYKFLWIQRDSYGCFEKWDDFSSEKNSIDMFFFLQKLLSRHKEMSEKAKAMMERLKNSPGSLENGKPDANVSHKTFISTHLCQMINAFSFRN